mmetsp:Transcript_14970/g.38415  ORF Transcript_14970/g.38415 Transcript_14970/m.38415 type:complete len:220 (-) Transcript_14970:1402-2061(-)
MHPRHRDRPQVDRRRQDGRRRRHRPRPRVLLLHGVVHHWEHHRRVGDHRVPRANPRDVDGHQGDHGGTKCMQPQRSIRPTDLAHAGQVHQRQRHRRRQPRQFRCGLLLPCQRWEQPVPRRSICAVRRHHIPAHCRSRILRRGGRRRDGTRRERGVSRRRLSAARGRRDVHSECPGVWPCLTYGKDSLWSPPRPRNLLAARHVQLQHSDVHSGGLTVVDQ